MARPSTRSGRPKHGFIYLYHFARPICPHRTTQHYAGWAIDITARDAEHRAGRGARLTQVAVERNIDFELVVLGYGTRQDERRLKLRKELKRFCPVCCAALGITPYTLPSHCQLPLDLEFPEPPVLPIDWYERTYFAPQVVRFDLGDTDGDIPF